jgi:uncharacterized protein
MMNIAANGLMIGLVWLLGLGVAVAEDLTPQKRNDTKTLLQITGAVASGKVMAGAVSKQMFDTLRAARPDLPPKTFDILSEEVAKAVDDEMGTMVDLMVALYHKYFSHAEIKQLLAFYQTPIGKKTAQLLPTMTQEGFAIGNRWGQERLGPIVGERVKARLKKEGIEL